MMNGDEKEKYVVGDLLWAKCGSHPYWPCMVSYDPLTGSYFKEKKVRSTKSNIYHVQYFGKQVQHGWTSPGLIFPFKSLQDYYDRKRAIRRSLSTSAAKRVVAKYKVPTGVHEAWIVAVREAEAAYNYDVEERYESFVFKYDINFKKSKKNGTSKKTKKRKCSNKPQKAKMAAVYYDELICTICQKGGSDLHCSGNCFQYFHKACLGIISAPDEFKCINCDQGLPTCFVCKKTAETYFKCNKCKYHYHEDCLKKFPCANIEKNICPYHVCWTCHNENPRNVSSKGPFVNCLLCPTTFHATSHCVPAASVKVKSSTVICPYHFFGKKKVSPQPTINVLYCILCAEGGDLICCESCPNAFHITCLNAEHVPIGDFFCEDCISRRYLYIGMVVWAKTGNFRWWPAQIVNVDELPHNVKKLGSYSGEFPIQYFGTNEYCWTHRGKVIPYVENHKDYYRTSSKQCKLDTKFKQSLEEASDAYDEYVLQRQLQNLDGQRDAYKHIKVNRPVPPIQAASAPKKNILPCSCNYNRPFPCSIHSGCLNRSMLMECHPDVCLAGARCENQKFQRREYAKVKVIKTKYRGWGLEAAQFIPKGSFVIEYVGEVITHEEYRRRVMEMQEKHIQNYYFLYLDARRMIDAGPQGNLSRFINHSCSPNCEMSKWSVNGDSRIGIFAVKDILPGEELSFNYQFDSVQFHQKCLCSSADCQGFIGKRPEKHKKFKSN